MKQELITDHDYRDNPALREQVVEEISDDDYRTPFMPCDPMEQRREEKPAEPEKKARSWLPHWR